MLVIITISLILVRFHASIYSMNLPAPNFVTDIAVESELVDDLEVDVKDVKTDSVILIWSSDEIFKNYQIYKYNFLLKKWDEYSSSLLGEITVNDLSPGTYYRFKVASSEQEVFSEIQLVSTEGEVSFFTLPEKSILKSRDSTSSSISLSWESSDTASYYEIYRGADNEKFQLLDTVDGYLKKYKDKDLKENTEYKYKIKSVI